MRDLAVLSGGFVFAFPRAILSTLNEKVVNGQSLTTHYTRGKHEIECNRFRALLNSRRKIGVICISMKPDEEVLAELRAEGISVILVDELMEGASSVAVDNYRGGFMVGEHFAKTGRKRFAVVCGDRKRNGGFNAIQRVQGFEDALKRNGLSLEPSHIIEVIDYSYGDGQRALSQILSERMGVDAIFSAAGDDCATGMLRTAQDNGIKIPDEIALVGFDDLATSPFATPALTTVRQPLVELAEVAYHLASDPSEKLISAPVRRTLEPVLIVRDSA